MTPDDLVEVSTHIAKTVDVTSPEEGDVIVFSIDVVNNGPANATNIEIQDVFRNILNFDICFTFNRINFPSIVTSTSPSSGLL